MTFYINRARQNLQSSNFRKLFIEDMGWDHPTSDLDITHNGDQLHLTAVAQKRGLTVLICSPLESGQLPGYADRRKIETQLRKLIHEHILIFTNIDYSKQVWQWVRREPGRPTTSREYEYYKGQSGQGLLERLQKLVFTLEEEESLGIVDVASRVRATFDVERVTKRFYDRFKDEHSALMKFLKGIPDEGMQRWYISVTLNRLMFVYFIQKKQFLNGDENYLRSKLIESKSKGQDLFYRDFLCPLFFEGFAMNKELRKPEMKRLLGDVPYLNGGIFQQHQIEIAHGKKIQIADAAFERVFDFFDQYRWHLDERPLRNDSEINPDVLGYIFEKYINQKEMGAYYTKEDITGYISRSTILPYLLDQAQKDCAIAFKGEQSVWRLLSSDPRRYIFPTIQKGCNLSLPAEIQAGVEDISRREGWNRPAGEEFSLPTETWRVVVARRTRYKDLLQKLEEGEIHEVNDLITFNLDIEQFTQDLVEASEGPELLRAFWKALRGIKVLDPTCGSGAFLFAALNILEPLYEACLERMRVFIAELDQSIEKHRPEKFSDFREVLDQVEQHHNEHYFILKSIIVNNLYGVDIMEEAVEICKLRLFLKLIAQVENGKDVEPLPDIDFNIRTGNTLVGFTSIDEVRQAFMSDGQQIRMLYPEEEDQIKKIEEEADLANRAYQQFQKQQLEKGVVTGEDKRNLREKLNNLNTTLNRALSKTYGIIPDKLDFTNWLENYKPFHWFVDFFGIMNNGGFTVAIGNPPYVSSSLIQYDLQHCHVFPDIYANVLSRTYSLVNNLGHIGMIIPLSITFSTDYQILRELVQSNGENWVSSFDNIPASIFAGVSQRCTIWITKISQNHHLNIAPMYRWRSDYRSSLIDNVSYTRILNEDLPVNGIPKIANLQQLEFLKVISDQINKQKLSFGTNRVYKIGFSQAARNFISVFLEDPPCIEVNTLIRVPSSKIGYVRLPAEEAKYVSLALLSGDMYFLYWLIRGDGFDVTNWIVVDFLSKAHDLSDEVRQMLSALGNLLHKYKNNALVFKKNAGKYVGNYNYRHLSELTRRVDLLLLSELGITKEKAISLIEYVTRVLSINIMAGEKGIPNFLREMFPQISTDKLSSTFEVNRIDSYLKKSFELTNDELIYLTEFNKKDIDNSN